MPLPSRWRTTTLGMLLHRLRAAWCGVGLTLLFIAVVESALRLGFTAKDALLPLPPIDPRVVADGYDGAPWVEDLYRELTTIAMDRLPYAEFRARPFTGRFHTIAVGGARATWPDSGGRARATPPGAVEVVVVGGSSAWGWGARDDQTLPSQLAKQLGDAGVAARVTNLAQIGYVSNQEWVLLLLWLRAGNHADVVISYGGVNDVLAAYQNGRAGWPQNEANRRREFNILASPRRLTGALAADLVRGSALFRLAGSAARRLGSRPGPPAPPGDLSILAATTADAHAESLATLAMLGREYHFTALSYWQPVVFTKKRLTPFEREKAAQYEWLREPIAQTRELLLKRNAGDTVRDLGGLFDEADPLVFTDFCHTTESANAAIAAAIVPDVIEALRRRTPP